MPLRSSVPSTPWTSRRGPPSTSGRAVATKAWSGVPRPIFWASARRSTIRALRIVGERPLGGAVDQRVEVGQPAQRLAGDRDRQPLVGRGEAARILARPHPASGPGEAPRSSIFSAALAGADAFDGSAISAILARGGRASNCSSSWSTEKRPASRPSTAATIGMSMPRSAASRASTGAVNAPSATVRRSAHQLGGRAALADALAQREIARAGRRAGQDQVAEARQAGQRFAPRAAGEPEAGHLGKAAGDQRGAGVLAEALALDHAAGDRQHVLDRAADLGADDVVAEVDAEIGQRDARRAALRPVRVVCDGKRHRGRQAGGDFMGEGRARQDRDRRVGAGLARDVVEQLARCSPRSPWSTGSAACRSVGACSSTERICCAGVTTSQASQSPSSARSPVARIAGSSGRPGRNTGFRGPR